MPAMLLQHHDQSPQEQEDFEWSRSHSSLASPAPAATVSSLRKSWPATSQNGLANNRRHHTMPSSTEHHTMTSQKSTEHHTLPSQKSTEKVRLHSPKTGKRRRSSFYKIFPDVAGVEEVIKSYHCALVGDILLQGSLYVTANWFCFCSKLLVKKSVKIPVSSITNISKKNTAKFIPNAIGVSTEKAKYVFGSLMSRDSTYQLLLSIWQHARGSVENGRILEDDANTCSEEMTLCEDQKKYVQSSTDEDFVFSSGCYSDVEEDGETSCSAVGMPLDASFSNLDVARNSSALGNSKSDGELQKQQLARFCDSHCSDTPKTEIIKRVFCCTSVKKMITRIQSLPTTCLYLSISTVLVLFLLFSAFLLTWKLINLQTEIDTVFSLNAKMTASSEHPRDFDGADLLSHQNSFARIEEIRKALEAQIILVDQVSQELLALKASGRMMCTISEGEERS